MKVEMDRDTVQDAQKNCTVTDEDSYEKHSAFSLIYFAMGCMPVY